MTFQIIDSVSRGAGRANEDRAGAKGSLAWIIDGATDVVEAPLTGEASDAAWFAETLHTELGATDAARSLPELVAALTDAASRRFTAIARRRPAGREEHPSAAGIICRIAGRRLDYVSLGDCALIAGGPGAVPRWHGIGTAGAGDAALAAVISRFNSTRATASAAATRRHIWPQVKAKRAAMNLEHGYGVFSITPPPARLIESGTIELAPGARILLLTDGLARLVDVFARHSPAALFEAACEQGLAALADELRAIEAGDAECAKFPRAKPSDDATGILLAAD